MLRKTIQQKHLDNLNDLEIIQSEKEIWSRTGFDHRIGETSLQTAILLDMRSCISAILYWSEELFTSHIMKLDILLACLENCNGHAFNILTHILDLNDLKLISFAQYHIEKFVMYEKSTDLICYHFLINSAIHFTVDRNLFGVVRYSKDLTGLFTGGSLKNLLNEYLAIYQQKDTPQTKREKEMLRRMIHNRLLKMIPHQLYEITRLGFIYMGSIFYVTKYDKHLIPYNVANAKKIPDYLLTDPTEKYYSLTIAKIDPDDIALNSSTTRKAKVVYPRKRNDDSVDPELLKKEEDE